MALPHFQGSVGGGTSCAQQTSLMLPKQPSKLAFFKIPTCCETSQATTQVDRLLAFDFKQTSRQTGPRQAGPPGASPTISRTAGAKPFKGPGVQSLPALVGASGILQCRFGGFLGGLPGSQPQGPYSENLLHAGPFPAPEREAG